MRFLLKNAGMDRLERGGRRHEDDFEHRAGVLQVDGGTPHHFFFQAVMAHVEKTKLRIQRRMVFDVAGDENVGTCGAGLLQQGGSRTGAVGHPPDTFRAGLRSGAAPLP